MLTHTQRAPVDAPGVICGVGQSDVLVELGHRGHPGHGHQVAAAEPTHLALHTPLLVSSAGAGHAEEAVEAVVGAQGHEALGLHAVAAFEDTHHRRLQVVIADAAGHAS